jgi:hypothetical protein
MQKDHSQLASGKLGKREDGIRSCKDNHSQMASCKLGKSFAFAPQDVFINRYFTWFSVPAFAPCSLKCLVNHYYEGPILYHQSVTVS